jgi:O-antigen ligase
MKLIEKFLNGTNLFWVLLFTILFTGAFLTNLQSQLVSTGLILGLTFCYLLQNKSVRLEKYDFFALAFLLFFNLSFYFNQTPFGFKEFTTYNLGFLLYFLIKNWKPTTFEQQLHNLYLKLAIVVTAVLLLLNLNGFLHSPLDRFAGFFFGDQAYSSYPNVLANFLLFLIPITYYRYIKESFSENRAAKLVYLFALLVYLTSFWLTSSRTSIIGVFLILGLSAGFLLIKFKSVKSLVKNISIAILTLSLSFLLALVVLDTKTYNLNYQSRINPNQDISAQKSVDERFVLFKNAFSIGKQNLLFGTGSGSFEYINPSYQQSSLVNSEHPHNLFLKLFAENGLFAVIFFILWLVSVLINALLVVVKNIKSSYFITFATVVGISATTFFDYNLGFTIIYILFFSLLGLLANYNLRNQPLHNAVILNFQPALKILVTILIPLFLYQAYIFVNLKNLESSTIQENKQQFLTSAAVIHNAPLAFKNDYLSALHNSEVDQSYFIDIYAEATQKWPRFANSYLYLALASSDLTTKQNLALHYLDLDFYNNFKAHLLKLELEQYNDEYLDKLKQILTDYNYLLSINAHHTVASENPVYVYKIYEKLTQRFPEDQILLAQFESFKNIYFDEMVKFDTRYSTTLLNDFYEWKNISF